MKSVRIFCLLELLSAQNLCVWDLAYLRLAIYSCVPPLQNAGADSPACAAEPRKKACSRSREGGSSPRGRAGVPAAPSPRARTFSSRAVLRSKSLSSFSNSSNSFRSAFSVAIRRISTALSQMLWLWCRCRSSILSTPPHISTAATKGLVPSTC